MPDKTATITVSDKSKTVSERTDSGVQASNPHDACPGSGVHPGPEQCRVDWPSLLECQGDDYEVYGQMFDSFDELKEYVVEGLDVVINRVIFVRDQVKKADDYESMDLEWWEPLVEKVRGM